MRFIVTSRGYALEASLQWAPTRTAKDPAVRLPLETASGPAADLAATPSSSWSVTTASLTGAAAALGAAADFRLLLTDSTLTTSILLVSDTNGSRGVVWSTVNADLTAGGGAVLEASPLMRFDVAGAELSTGIRLNAAVSSSWNVTGAALSTSVRLNAAANFRFSESGANLSTSINVAAASSWAWSVTAASLTSSPAQLAASLSLAWSTGGAALSTSITLAAGIVATWSQSGTLSGGAEPASIASVHLVNSGRQVAVVATRATRATLAHSGLTRVSAVQTKQTAEVSPSLSRAVLS